MNPLRWDVLGAAFILSLPVLMVFAEGRLTLDELTTKLGAQGGDAAEAYVLAHEFGHHVQDLEGTLQRVQGGSGGTGPTSPGVRLELQADCYAGVWFNHATNDPQSPISEVTQADLDDALDAAAARAGLE